MTSSLVVRRIEAWEAAGLIDARTAALLREAEARTEPESPAAEARPPGTGHALGITAVELFSYLGAAFVLGAWYALVASTIPTGDAAAPWFAAAGLVAAAVLGATGAWLARRDPRSRRAAGVALLVALPNLGSGIYLLADTLHHEEWAEVPADALVASIVVLAAAFLARRVVPGLVTQLGLAIAAATAGWFAMGWLDAVLFKHPEVVYAGVALDATTALVRVVLTMAWWWAVAAGMAVVLVILDPGPRTESRTRLGRIAAGTTAVLGTTMAVFIRYEWSESSSTAGEPVLEPFVGAAILLAVAGVLTVLAIRRSSVGYLWPGGLGVFIALSWLNAEYLAVESGLWFALLVEAGVLFGVAFGVQRLGRRLRPSRPVGPEPGTIAAGPDADPAPGAGDPLVGA